MSSFLKSSFLSLFLIFSLSVLVFAQSFNTEQFPYISPVPGSKLNTNETTIIIRYIEAFDNYNLPNCIEVKGEKSGPHSGNIILAENGKTLIFKPDIPFSFGETVSVTLAKKLRTISNQVVPTMEFSFETSKVNLNKPIKTSKEIISQILNPGFRFEDNSFLTNPQQNTEKIKYTIQKDSLPENFPGITVNTLNNASPGYVFMAPFYTSGSSSPNYLIIADNYGIPVFYRKMVNEWTLDFMKQPSGILSFYNEGKFYLMDSDYQIVDSVYTESGYQTDVHDCLLLENKHSLLLSYDKQNVNMDTVVSGGAKDAVVTGLVIQEIDENKNVVFQWRSWDHYKITDATYDIILTAKTIDYVHGNAIEVDSDGNLILSCRHMDEITKINRQTGDIIWRWGGVFCKNNEFTFINDSIGFSHQHDIRKLPGGNFSVFDNGNLHTPQFSRAAEYQVDEINKTATLVWEYPNTPHNFSMAMGSNRLINNNVLIGWGWAFSPAVTEIDKDQNVKLQISIPDSMVNYRAFKFPWKTNLFVTNPDSLFFENVAAGDSLTKSLEIISNSNKEIEINGLLNRDSVFQVNSNLPIIIPAFGHVFIQVTFKPTDSKNYSDDLYLQWNLDHQRIAQVVI